MVSEIIQKDVIRKIRRYNKTVTEEQIIIHFGLEYGSKKLLCPYCDKILIHKTQDKDNEYKDVPSIDHKMPRTRNLISDDDLDNIVVCCQECNIIKNTMDDSTYKEFVKLLLSNPNLKNEVFNQLWTGRKANFFHRHLIKCPKCSKISDIDEFKSVNPKIEVDS